MLVVGLGGGVALESVPSSIEQIDVVELESEVVEANRAVAASRARDPLADPRVRIHANDARNALLLTEQRFDEIVSQPSHPWSAGASHLYTREFFDLVAGRLSDDGVFVQWIGFGFVDETLFRSLLASLTDVFESVRVYSPPPHAGALLLASNVPLDVEASAAEWLRAHPGELEDLGLHSSEDVAAALLINEIGARELAQGAPMNRDGDNLLQIESPRVSTRSLLGGIPSLVSTTASPLASIPETLDVWYLLRQLPPWQAQPLVDTLDDPVERKIGEALIQMAKGKREGPRILLREVLDEAPRNGAGRAALLLLSEQAIAQGADPLDFLAAPLGEAERTVASGWKRLAAGAAGVGSLEPELASIPVRHPLAVAAYRLRTESRMGSPEAIEMADRVLHLSGGLPRDRLLRARASAAAGQHPAALDTLWRMLPMLDRRSPRSQALAILGLRVLDTIPASEELAVERRVIEARLQAQSH